MDQFLVEAPFDWDGKKETAAYLLGATSNSFREVAKSVDVSVDTMREWRRHPDFQTRVKEYEDEELDEVRRHSYARKSNRVRGMIKQIEDIDAVVQARSRQLVHGELDDPETSMTGVYTGQIVVQKRALGTGEFMEVTTDYTFDALMAKERRESMKHLAQELGQWVEKSEQTGEGTGVVQIVFEDADVGPQ